MSALLGLALFAAGSSPANIQSVRGRAAVQTLSDKSIFRSGEVLLSYPFARGSLGASVGHEPILRNVFGFVFDAPVPSNDPAGTVYEVVASPANNFSPNGGPVWLSSQYSDQVPQVVSAAKPYGSFKFRSSGDKPEVVLAMYSSLNGSPWKCIGISDSKTLTDADLSPSAAVGPNAG